jgi:hypothetical protein
MEDNQFYKDGLLKECESLSNSELEEVLQKIRAIKDRRASVSLLSQSEASAQRSRIA